MNLKAVVIIFCFQFLLNTDLWANDGEALLPLTHNSALNDASNQAFHQQKSIRRDALLTLPFFEDFNQSSFYPDINRWVDNFTYINNTYPVNPPSLGVATFDGLNPLGQPYSLNATDIGRADKLTSLPLALNGLLNTDDVYLSFYYQTEGLGEKPQRNIDYLLLEFLDTSGAWVEVWRANPSDTLPPFVQAFVKIEAPYLYDGFQFRWVNIARLSGNNDHWHLDYIKLDKGRNPLVETTVPDLAFTSAPSKVFKEYYTLPYKHFTSEMLLDTLSVRVFNNFSNTVDIVDNFSVYNLADSSILDAYNGPSIDLVGLSPLTFPYRGIDIPEGLTGDTIRIGVTYNFQTSAENSSIEPVRANNTLKKIIEFGNYFALDDASAERAYRLVNFDFGKMAVRYTTTVPDTLRTLKIHFANLNNDYSSTRFNIVIWSSIDTPGGTAVELYRDNLLAISDFRKPFGDKYNDFSFYALKPDSNGKDYLVLDGDFFIGIELEKDNVLDVGYDVNTDGGSRQYFNVGRGWFKTQFNGALMINPIMGKALDWPYVGIQDNTTQFIDIKAYPNPTRDIIYLKKEVNQPLLYKVMNMTGSIMSEGKMTNNTQPIDVSALSAGVYILIIEESNGVYAGRTKFVKQ